MAKIVNATPHAVKVVDEMGNVVKEFFIVSAMVKAALPARSDLLVPAEQVRDDQGRVIGCRSLGL